MAELAREFAGAFGTDDPASGEWAAAAGWLHDAGKLRPAFQERLAGENVRAEHSGAGAALAYEKGGAHAVPLAFVVAGHHAGLANAAAPEPGTTPLRERLAAARPHLDEIRSLLPSELASLAVPPSPERFRTLDPKNPADMQSLAFWTRMLFSALVDADRLATGSFTEPGAREAALAGFSEIADLEARLDAYLERLVAELPEDRRESPVNRRRAEVLAACRGAAESSPGFFSLTVPTGGGKTLSALAFALRHARLHGLRRVVTAIPYTSITEQNAAVWRGALGEENVIEHHSALDPDESTEEARETEHRRSLAAENWEAPVIVTTNVQLLESLFTSRPGRARKIHRLARSVILLDEAQTLPVPLLLPVLDGLRELVEHYGATVVLTTATQPALAEHAGLPQGLGDVREIVPDPAELARSLARVEVDWPEVGEVGAEPDPLPYAELAERIAAEARALAIVHLRRDARELAELLPEEGRFHLSALMCPAHRREVLGRVKQALTGDGPCRLVSTQLIEAGVDVDFPVVFRALGGLDSIAQAAGRCNREGRLPGKGRLVVFRAPTPPPPGLPRAGLQITELMLRQAGGALELDDPDLFRRYFQLLYGSRDLDEKRIQSDRASLSFATVGRKFKLIEDGYSEAVVVPWGEGSDRLEELRSTWAAIEAGRGAPSELRRALRRLQPFTVNVPRRLVEVWERSGVVETVAGLARALTRGHRRLYHETYGLTLPDDPPPADPAALMI